MEQRKKIIARNKLASPPREQFGRYLNRIRINAGLTQQEAARRLGMSPSLLAQYEVGRTVDPSGDFLRAVVREYNQAAKENGKPPNLNFYEVLFELIEDKYGDNPREVDGPRAFHDDPMHVAKIWRAAA